MLREKYHQLVKQTLQEHAQVFERQNLVQLQAAMDSIAAAKRIFVIGVGREGLAARSFVMRLMHLGKEVYWIWDDTTPAILQGDLLLAVNGSGQIGHICYVAEQARAAGGSILIVTGSPNQARLEDGDGVLFIPACVYKGTDPRAVESGLAMGSLFEQHTWMLFDIIIQLLEWEMKVDHVQMAARHRNVE